MKKICTKSEQNAQMSIVFGLKICNSLKYLIVNSNIYKNEITSSVQYNFTALMILYMEK